MQIIKAPNPILKKRSKPVIDFDKKLRELIATMKDVCEKSVGVGLSAVQIGIHQRVLVYKHKDKIIAMINPVIKFKGTEKVVRHEGCLSVEGTTRAIRRPKTIIVSYLDGHGDLKIKKFYDLRATIIQHEIDHMNGILITDHPNV